MEGQGTPTGTLSVQVAVNRFHEQSLPSEHRRGLGDGVPRRH